MTPRLVVRRVMRLRAPPWGTYSSRSATASTRARVVGLTGPLLFSTRETVATETPA